MANLVGQTIGEYRVVAHLGQGGMAQVYKAYDPGEDRFVALKVLHPHLAQDPDLVGRFQREAQACATLQHPCIVRVFDYSHHGDSYYMTMQLIEGPTLRKELQERIQSKRPFRYEDVVRLGAAYCDGLAYAHNQGMIHRDIKPANLTLTHAGQAVILDFGIARILGETQYTMTGALIGSPAYMSPEQGQSADVDGRSDIYSLGVVLYEMVTGRPPFSEDTPIATLIKHITVPVPMPRTFRPDLPPALEAILLKTLKKKPAERFQSGAELAAALRYIFRLPANGSLLKNPIAPIAKIVVANELSLDDPTFLQAENQATRPLNRSRAVECRHCGTVNKNPTKFCIQCGKQLRIVCPSCFWLNDPDVAFCEHCDFNLREAIQRKSQWQNEEEHWKEERHRAFQKAETETIRQQLLNLHDPTKHEMAVFSLKNYSDQVVEPLVKLLRHKEPNVRVGAAKALGAIGDKRVVPPLVSCLSDPQPAVRYWVIDALWQLRAESAVDAIGDLLQDDHKKVKEYALKTLQRFDTPQARAIIKKKSKHWWSLS